MFRVEIGEDSFEYRVDRRKRKSIGIKVTGEGEVIVASPLNVGDEYIRELVISKADWILSKLKLAEEVNEKKVKREFITGEGVPYLGKEYKIQVIEDVWEKGARVSFNNNIFKIYISPRLKENRNDFIRAAFEGWMRERAREVFRDRTIFYSNTLKLYPNRIVVKDQKSVWGSCSGKGNINYNYRLIMAPIEIIDYIVVHELCHMRHPNHSKEYWNMVEGIVPDYREKRDWLRKNGSLLSLG